MRFRRRHAGFPGKTATSVGLLRQSYDDSERHPKNFALTAPVLFHFPFMVKNIPVSLICLTLGLGAPLMRATVTADNLRSFEGIEEPELRYIIATGKFVYDPFVNITDVGDHAVRMTLRYNRDWWDSDRDRIDTTRQRAEVKGLGPHQKPGETFEYATTWRTDPDFRGSDRFCHVFQLKATDGDNGLPLVVLSVLDGVGHAGVRYCPGKEFLPVRDFPFKPGAWQNVRIRIKTSEKDDGEVLVSVDGDDFQGAKGVRVSRPEASDYRPKWGLYRGLTKGMAIHDDWVEHRASAQKL